MVEQLKGAMPNGKPSNARRLSVVICSAIALSIGGRVSALCVDPATSVGPGEFRVNCSTANDQSWPRVAAGSDGAFVFVWESGELDGGDVVARHLSAGSLGPEILINSSFPAGAQQRPAIAARQADYVVAFGSDHVNGPGVGQVYTRRLDPQGGVLGVEDLVSQGSPPQVSCDENTADVAVDTDDSFLVAWSARGCVADTAHIDIFGRAYDAAAAPRGNAFPYNSIVPGSQHVPHLLRIGPDRYVGAWRSSREVIPPLTYDRIGHLVQSASPIGIDFQINETVDGSHSDQGGLAPAPGGGFLATWTKSEASIDNGVYRRFFDNAGVASGPEVLIAATPATKSVIAQSSTGTYLVIWADADGDGNGVYGQYLAGDGSLIGSPLLVNQTTIGNQGSDFDIAADANGGFLVTWMSDGQDGSGEGIYARYLSGTCGNGVVDQGECCDLGVANGEPGSGCTGSCGCVGLCTIARTECATASDCPSGQGCCGNTLQEADEQCDDGNLQPGDSCTPACQNDTGVAACPGVFGPQLLAPISMRAKFRNRDGDPEYEQWSANRRGQAGDFNLAFGQQIDPCHETIRAEFFENDGSGGRRILGEFTLEPDDLTTCVERPPGSGDERYKMLDQTEMSSTPAGVQKASVQEKGNKVKFKLKGKTLASILRPNNSTIRFCLHVGDDAGGAVLTCEERSNGDLLKCESTN